MFIDFLLERFQQHATKDALVWNEQIWSYSWLLQQTRYWCDRLEQEKVAPGTVVMVEADFSPNSVALFLALIERTCIFVPITKSVSGKKQEFVETSMAELLVSIDDADKASFQSLSDTSNHEYYRHLRDKKLPGLVLFSSGSTGKSKAAVHNLANLLDKFKVQRSALRGITFLLYDHIGGVNTLLYTLSNGGCVITVSNRQPDAVAATIEKYKAELLPTSPTFINLLLLSEAYKDYDLSSLHTVTYGTEPMPESTLQRFHQLFPHIKLLQTYGLSEVGILRSKSKDSSSLWMKVGGEGFETRITDDGILEIKAHSGMLGYLNAPSPYTDDGWFHTGDMVEQEGEFIKVLGRKSEIINVGGQKVFPAEVESILQKMPEVAEAEVYPEANPLMGNIVCAKVRPAMEIDNKDLKKRIKRFCAEHLESFKIPAKVKQSEAEQFSPRFKKQRSH